MGSGKTTVLGEASDLLGAVEILHAAIDLDSLALGHRPAAASHDLLIRNLAAVWNNYAAAGISRLLLSEVLDTAATQNAATPIVARKAGMTVVAISCEQSLNSDASPMPSTVRLSQRIRTAGVDANCFPSSSFIASFMQSG